MMKPKSSQSSQQQSQKSLNKCCLPARKLMSTVFWDRKGMLTVEFMQQRTQIGSVLQNIKKNGMWLFGTKGTEC
jgi:hypothetical protein